MVKYLKINHTPLFLILLPIYLIIYSQHSFAQNTKIDSLLKLLQLNKSDTDKIKYLNNLSSVYIKLGKYPEANKNSSEALALALKQPLVNSGIKKEMANSYTGIGIVLYYQGNYPEALKNHFNALKIRKEIIDKQGIAISYNNIGLVYTNQGDYSEALKNHFSALKIREEIKDKLGAGNSYNNIGLIYNNQGNYPEALKNHFAALKIREDIADKFGISYSYSNIGSVYTNQGNYPEALKNHFAALKIREEIADKPGISASNNNIGLVYELQGNYDAALKKYFTSLDILKEIDDKQAIAAVNNNIGIIYWNQNNFERALKNYFEALDIQQEIGDKPGAASTLTNIGGIYLAQSEVLYTQNGNVDSIRQKLSAALKKFTIALEISEGDDIKELKATSYINLGAVYTRLAWLKGTNPGMLKSAGDYLNKALELSKEIGSKECIKFSYAGLVTLDSTNSNYKAAFDHRKLYIIYRDSIDNEETRNKTIQNTMLYEFEKKEIASKSEQEKIDAISAEEKQKQSIIIYSVAGVLLLVIVFSLFLFNRFRIAKRQKNTIEKQKIMVDSAYERLHEKNKEVMDSIYYARRIQRALLTSEKYIERNLNRLRGRG